MPSYSVLLEDLSLLSAAAAHAFLTCFTDLQCPGGAYVSDGCGCSQTVPIRLRQNCPLLSILETSPQSSLHWHISHSFLHFISFLYSFPSFLNLAKFIHPSALPWHCQEPLRLKLGCPSQYHWAASSKWSSDTAHSSPRQCRAQSTEPGTALSAGRSLNCHWQNHLLPLSHV